jgi:hypothetical protein
MDAFDKLARTLTECCLKLSQQKLREQQQREAKAWQHLRLLVFRGLAGEDVTTELLEAAEPLDLVIDDVTGLLKSAAKLLESDADLLALSMDSGARGAWYGRADTRARLLQKHPQLFADIPTDAPKVVPIPSVDDALADLLRRWREAPSGENRNVARAEKAFATIAWRCVDGGTIDDETVDDVALASTRFCDGTTMVSLVAEQVVLERMASADPDDPSTWLGVHPLAARLRLEQLDASVESKRAAVSQARRERCVAAV